MTPLELIWSGWRLAYVQQAGERPTGDTEGSVFTRILRSGLPDDETYILHRGRFTFAILNVYPYTSGHLLVLPYREIAQLEDLDAEEAAELWATVTDAVRAVKLAYLPGGLNVGVNLGRAAGGSIDDHLHVHVLPRWAGDGNFIAAVANARTLPETLSDSAAKLRAAWPI